MNNLFGPKKSIVEKNKTDDVVSNKRKKTSLSSFLNDLNSKHGNLLATDPECERDFSVYTANRALSQFRDCIMWCEEMNRRPQIPKQLYYGYMYGKLRKRKRFSKWHKPYNDDDVDFIIEVYKYSRSKAVEALEIINKTPGALAKLRDRYKIGGT